MTVPIQTHQATAIAITVAIVAGIVALVVLGWRLMRKLSRWMSGWDTLADEFPPADIQPDRGEFKAGGIVQGRKYFTFRDGGNSSFRLQPTREGLAVRATFAPDRPILIPWGRISKIDEIDLGLLGSSAVLTVQSQRMLQLYLPKDALPAIEEHVPAEEVHKMGSLLKAIKARMESGRLNQK